MKDSTAQRPIERRLTAVQDELHKRFREPGPHPTGVPTHLRRLVRLAVDGSW